MSEGNSFHVRLVFSEQERDANIDCAQDEGSTPRDSLADDDKGTLDIDPLLSSQPTLQYQPRQKTFKSIVVAYV